MGDRTGLTRLDRTNGYEDGRGYMRVKKSKLAEQNDQIREALRHRNSTMRTDIFKGISINVNGRTQPTADELKRLILLNGGDYHPYYRYQTTKFMIATNLSMARMKQLRPDDRVVKPEWITESIQAKCLLPYQDYQLFAEEPRGKQSVLAIDSDSNSMPPPQMTLRSSTGQSASISNASTTSTSASDNQQLVPVSKSYTTNYRKPNNNGRKSNEPVKNNRDIREMFTKSYRSLDHFENESKKKSQSNSQSDNSQSNPAATDSDNKNSTSNHERNAENSANQNLFVANICGLTNLDEIIRLMDEWVGCREGVIDEDIQCVRKYFYDLMQERNYHNKFYEVIDALQSRVKDQNNPKWIQLYNELANCLKEELSQSIAATQNLYQLISLIEDESPALAATGEIGEDSKCGREHGPRDIKKESPRVPDDSSNSNAEVIDID